jgi:two-component system, OmpR family, response regulator PhoP
MAHLILVEDNLSYAEDVADYLIEIGHNVRISGSAAAMWLTLAQGPADIVILDLGLPDDCGFNIIPRMRQLYPEIGLLVLTARVMLDSRIQGLRLGADNYLTKPIKFPELAAHIEALSRRVQGHDRTVQPAAQEWLLRSSERQLQVNDSKAIDLTEKEFNFLHLLAISTRPVAREALNIGIGGDEHEEAKRIDMLVYRLRKKVKASLGEELPLHSAYGEGYSLSVAFNLA